MYANIFVVMGVSMEKISYERFVKLVNSFDEFNEKLLFALYEKYQDDDTSPAKESLKRVTEKIIEENSNFYKKTSLVPVQETFFGKNYPLT